MHIPHTLSDGSRHWEKNTQLHRIGGPASVTGLYRAYYQQGKLFRSHGPVTMWFVSHKNHY